MRPWPLRSLGCMNFLRPTSPLDGLHWDRGRVGRGGRDQEVPLPRWCGRREWSLRIDWVDAGGYAQKWWLVFWWFVILFYCAVDVEADARPGNTQRNLKASAVPQVLARKQGPWVAVSVKPYFVVVVILLLLYLVLVSVMVMPNVGEVCLLVCWGAAIAGVDCARSGFNGIWILWES